MTSQSCDIRKKHTVQSIVVFATLLIFFGMGCNTINPKLQDEYIRDSVSIGLKTVINDSRQAVKEFMLDEKVQGTSVALIDCNGILSIAGFGYTDKKQKDTCHT